MWITGRISRRDHLPVNQAASLGSFTCENDISSAMIRGADHLGIFKIKTIEMERGLLFLQHVFFFHMQVSSIGGENADCDQEIKNGGLLVFSSINNKTSYRNNSTLLDGVRLCKSYLYWTPFGTLVWFDNKKKPLQRASF